MLKNMKQHLFLIGFLIVSLVGCSQEASFKEYSHAELFQMIDAEQDSIFELKDAIIIFV